MAAVGVFEVEVLVVEDLEEEDSAVEVVVLEWAQCVAQDAPSEEQAHEELYQGVLDRAVDVIIIAGGQEGTGEDITVLGIVDGGVGTGGGDILTDLGTMLPFTGVVDLRWE